MKGTIAMRYFVKACENVILCKVKCFKTDFYDYDVPRLNKLKKTDRAILIIRETGTYLYINFNIDNGEPSRITRETAVDLINDFYIKHLQRAILAHSKAEDEYYSPKGLRSDMKCPRIEDFGITRGEYFNMRKGNAENVLLNRDIKSDDLEDYVKY